MSHFGKYGTGGEIPPKPLPALDETGLDEAAATLGTIDNQPNSVPAAQVKPGVDNGETGMNKGLY